MSVLYRILIADDEPYALEGIMHGIPFRELGFDRIFTAGSVSEAKQVLLSNDVDVVLSDIEMPDESGLDLLKWMREYRIDAVPIILTCHADFEYSRTALKSGSFDYILKPIAYEEVAETLKRATERVEQKKRLRQANRREALLMKNRDRLSGELWADIFSGRLQPTAPVMEELCLIRNIPFVPEAQYRLVLVDCLVLEPGEAGSAAAERLASGLDRLVGQDGWCLRHEGRLVAVLRRTGSRHLSSQELRGRLTGLFRSAAGRGELSFNAFFSQNVEAGQLPAAFSRLRQASERRCIKTGAIEKITDDVELERSVPILPDVGRWVSLMETETAQDLTDEMVRYAMQALSQPGGTGQLELCAEVCVQAVYVACSKLRLRTDFLLATDLQRQIHLAIRGRDNYSDFVSALMSAFCQRRDKIYQSRRKSIVEQARDYVDAHLDERLQNDQVARALFLNADHLSRAFKKESGLTLSEYISIRRIDRAKLLLLTTQLPVSEVALRVGFQSFSYFSKIFKKRVGVEPSKFRAKNS